MLCHIFLHTYNENAHLRDRLLQSLRVGAHVRRCSVLTSTCMQGRSQAGRATTGNYCVVVKHHYSLICPLVPSVLLGATLYTISTAPRTTPPTHTDAHHPSHKDLAYKGTPRITPALSLYILHHCLFFLPYAVFSSLFCCSLTIWVRYCSCSLPCITLIYQEAKPYFMLQPHLLPCIRPDELMNAGSDACPPFD